MHLAASAQAWGEGQASPRSPLLDLLARTGYEGVEYPVRYRGHATQLEQAARRRGLRIVAAQHGIPDDLAVDAAAAARVRQACLDLRQAGGTYLLLEPPRHGADPTALGAWLRLAQDWVRHAGIIPCVLTVPHSALDGAKALGLCLAEAGRLVSLALDLAALRDGGAAAEVVAAHPRSLAYVRLADHDDSGRPVALGQGRGGVGGFVQALSQAGYMGWLVARCPADEGGLTAARSFLEESEVIIPLASRYPRAAAR
jgi:sugar phosphate isomerase/epimerase